MAHVCFNVASRFDAAPNGFRWPTPARKEIVSPGSENLGHPTDDPEFALSSPRFNRARFAAAGYLRAKRAGFVKSEEFQITAATCAPSSVISKRPPSGEPAPKKT